MVDMNLLIAEYIDSIRDDIDSLEGLILSCESGEVSDANRNKILRIVHSLKGSSGSYGFRHISRLCHSFEDYFINATKNEEENLDIDRLLKTLDQFKTFIETGEDCEAPIGESVSAKRVGGGPKVLIVNNSSFDTKLLTHALLSINADVKSEKDGLNAIDLILARRFDAIILSTTMTGIDGLSLLKAIKVIDSPNKNTKIAILTTRSSLKLDAQFKPDLHLVKDEKMNKALPSLLNDLLAEKKGESLPPSEFPYKHVVYLDDTTSLHALMKMALKKTGCRLDCFDKSDEATDFIKILYQINAYSIKNKAFKLS
jgi:chemotaxis protein histidine kinase CheA